MRTLTSVPQAPVAMRRPPGSFISSNRISPRAFGLPRLKGRPAMAWISVSMVAMRVAKSRGHAAELGLVELDARLFHGEEDGDEAALELLVGGEAAGGAEAGAEQGPRGGGRRRRLRRCGRRRGRGGRERGAGGRGRCR